MSNRTKLRAFMALLALAAAIFSIMMVYVGRSLPEVEMPAYSYQETVVPGMYFVPSLGPQGREQYPKVLTQLLSDHPDLQCRFMGSEEDVHGKANGFYLLCEQPPAPCEPDAIDAQLLTVP